MTKIQLPTDSIRNFLNVSKYISADIETIPILGYIKIDIEFGVCTLTKSNQNQFCQYSFSVIEDDISFLIEEKKLASFCKTTKSLNADYNIDLLSSRILIHDGYQKYECNSKVVDINNFPVIPVYNSNSIKLNKNLISYLNSAKTYVGKDKMRENFMSVYIDGNTLYSSNAMIGYIRYLGVEISNNLIAFSEKECSLFSNFDYIEFSKSENYNTFKYENVIYGSIQPHYANGFDFRFLTNNVKKENFFSIKKEDLENFCSSAREFSGNDYGTATLKIISEDKAILIYLDSEKDEKVEMELPIRFHGEKFDFHFYPVQIQQILSSLDFGDVFIGDEKSLISIFNPIDDKFVCIVSKVVIQ